MHDDSVDDDDVSVTSLVGAALQGDEHAWRELVNRYARLVMFVLARYRIFDADADDVSQVVWLRLVEHLDELREPRALPRWLVTTTRNECVRLLRTNRRTQPVDPLAEGLAGQVSHAALDEPMLRAERSQAFLEALAELDERHRAVLLLLTEDPPVPYAEISRRLDIPIGSIGPVRSRALQKLRSSRALAEWFEEGSE